MESKWFHMASITLKNLPEKTLARLRALARRERRSLNLQAISLIEDGLRRVPRARVSRDGTTQVAAWRELGGRWRSDASARKEIDAIYQARTGGRAVEL